MNPEIEQLKSEFKRELDNLRNEVVDIRFLVARKTGLGSADIKGRIASTSGSAGVLPSDSVTAAMLQSNSITKVKVADDAVGGNEWDYEVANITITDASTSGTASVTSGSVPVGYYLTAFTTPTASYVQLAVSGTTLTATLSAAPGAGNSVSIRTILIKV